MKTTLVVLLSVIAGACPAVHAAEKPPASSAYEASVAQDQLRRQTKKLREDLRALLEEFQNNRAAGAELAQGRAILERLDTLSDAEMMEVVKALREASSSTDPAVANNRLATAGVSQKNIQSSLRGIADRLTAQKDEASMRQRLRQLAVRQTSAQRHGQILASRWYDKPVIELAVAEQEAITKDVSSAMETLQRLSTGRAISAPAFAAAFAVGTNARLVDQAGLAATETTAKKYAEAVAPQGQVVEALLQMVDRLNSTRRPEERVREAATRMKEIASNQKQLADSTQKSYVAAGASIKKRQSDLTDEVAVLQREISQLNQAAAAQTEKTGQEMNALNDLLDKNRVILDKLEGKNQVVEAQRDAAKKLADIGKMLQEQAKALAAANQQGEGETPNSAALDPKFAAMQDATNKLLDAKAALDFSAKSVRSDTGLAQQKMDAATAALTEAQSALAQAGGTPEEGVGENMEGAKGDIQKGKEQAGGNKELAHHNIGKAQDKVDAALGGLQKMMNSLAAAKGAPIPGHGDGAQPGKGGPGPLNGGTGNPNGGGALHTDVSATGGISPQDRAALSLLQREKPPLEYNEMVRQYLKNLADGGMPGQ